MRTFFKLALLLAITCTSFGCAHNYYNIPQETLEKKVKTIGVAPIFTDADSDIRHPDKSSLVGLIQAYNQKYDWDYQASQYGDFATVQPQKVLAWRTAGAAGRDSFRSTGCWIFDDSA